MYLSDKNLLLLIPTLTQCVSAGRWPPLDQTQKKSPTVSPNAEVRHRVLSVDQACFMPGVSHLELILG